MSWSINVTAVESSDVGDALRKRAKEQQDQYGKWSKGTNQQIETAAELAQQLAADLDWEGRFNVTAGGHYPDEGTHPVPSVNLNVSGFMEPVAP